MNIADLIKSAFSRTSLRTMTPVDADRRHSIEKNLQNISDGGMSTSLSYDPKSLIKSFPEWGSFAENLTDPDTICAAIYAAFQPLYDCLVDQHLNPDSREKALNLLNGITVL